MFTVKAVNSGRTRIYEAESLTVLTGGGGYEVTLHRHAGDDIRIDVTSAERLPDWPEVYDSVIVENSQGKTSDIYRAAPAPRYGQTNSTTPDNFTPSAGNTTHFLKPGGRIG